MLRLLKYFKHLMDASLGIQMVIYHPINPIHLLVFTPSSHSLNSVAMDTYEGLTKGVSIVKNSLNGVAMDFAEGLAQGARVVQEFDLNKHAEEAEVEVESKVVEGLRNVAWDVFTEKEFSSIDLNKFPEDDYENDSFEEKEKKKNSD